MEIQYFNILKGIGILLVVIGHITAFGGPVNTYCYSYHLALFFFVTGFLYNEKKYGHNPALYFGNKIKNNWSKFVIYASSIGLLHFTGKFLGIYHLVDGSWDLYTFKFYVINVLFMSYPEPLCGAMWFVVPLIMASGIFGLIVYIGNSVKKYTDKEVLKHVIIILFIIFCLLLGNDQMTKNEALRNRLDVALFVVPLLGAGYYIGTYVRDFRKYLKIYIAIPCFCVTIYFCHIGYINYLSIPDVEIKKYYLLAVAGIYQSMYLAKVLCSLSGAISHIFSFIGKYSFEIMSFHFLVFKMVDVFWFKMIGDVDVNILTYFPKSYNIWWAYIVLGCGIPAICRWIFDKVMIVIKSKIYSMCGGGKTY